MAGLVGLVEGLRYGGSTLAPDDEVCCLRLDSPTRAVVEALVDRLRWADVRISEVLDVPEEA